jgi:class 3 adenylate cyclase
VEKWLQAIGLGHYIEAFRTQKINLDQLADLTDDDLKDLGLLIGERRRFRRAAFELAPAGSPPTGTPSLVSTFTERRPLTMMFIDLVGSSELGELLEPEDLMEVIRRYREYCGVRIQRYGGTIARHIGDGMLVYFSYPVATENDPERSVRAALDIIREIEHLVTPAPRSLQVRIGIATGRVIMSDLVTSNTADLRTILGSPPNLAARLQGLAAPGTVVIAAETYERIRNLFAAENLGRIEVRGFATRQRAWRVLYELPRRGSRMSGLRQIPFGARGAELAFLAQRWVLATQGIGQAVLLSGEAGIGKSRLVEAFLASNCADHCRVVELYGSPLDADSALLPFATWLRGEIDRGHLSGGFDLTQLLGVGWSSPQQDQTPTQLREAIFAALINRLLEEARAGAVCIVVEDLHWLDPSSLEVLSRFLPRIAGQRILLLLTARDSFEVPWLSPEIVSRLELTRLAQVDIAAIVQSMVDGAALPTALVAQILRKSEGLPLFAVELVRGLLSPDGGAATIPPYFLLPDEASGDVPTSLRDSLMARLDRAGLAKEVAQAAAVIGRSVKPVILANVTGLALAELEGPLDALIRAGVLYHERTGPSEAYTFTHALLQDAAYDSILRDHRRRLHRRVSRALVRLDPKLVGQQPELLALHLTEAARAEAAGPHWIEAARRSLKRSALPEAKQLLRRGLAGLENAAESVAVRNLRLDMMALLGPVLIGVDGPGAPVTQELYDAAWRLCQLQPDSSSYFPIYWGWWRVSRDYADKLTRARILLDRARLGSDDGLLLQAHHCAWASHYCVGEFGEACQHAEAGLAIYAGGDYRDHARQYGNHDAAVCAHGELAQAFWMRGKPIRATAHECRSIALAQQLNHLGSLLHAMDMRLLHQAYRGDVSIVAKHAIEFINLATQHELRDHWAKALIFQGWALARDADVQEGRRMLEKGIASQWEVGTDEDFPIYITLLADILIRAGEAELAVEKLRGAHDEFVRRGLQVWMPEVLRLIGVATAVAHPGNVTEPLRWFAESHSIAANQGAHMLYLRTAVSLADLYLKCGEVASAAQALSTSLEMVEEDDTGADMRAAHALRKKCELLGFTV